MSKVLLLITVSFIFSNKTNYWNLGLSINSHPKRVIKKDIKIHNIVAEDSHVFQKNQNNTIYTLDKSYIIEPQKHQNTLPEYFDAHSNEYFYDIKILMANNQYFEAAKKLISLDTNQIDMVFDGYDDYHYCSSIIYYNLGNMDEAYLNLEKISHRSNNPELIFLEALILQGIDDKKSLSLLKNIIQHFPNEDYAEYAKDILKDNQ